MRTLVEELVGGAIAEVNKLREKGKIEIASLEAKRTCLAEKTVYDYIKNELSKKLGNNFLLLTEGFSPFGDKNAVRKFLLDPLDGTLYYVRKKTKNTFPVSIALSLIEGDNYENVNASAVGDIFSGEIWSADKNSRTISNFSGECKINIGEKNEPLFQSDFYFPENAKARLKLRHPFNQEYEKFEFQNSGSVSSQLAKIACGEADAYIGVVGPSVFEISAGYLLIKKAGGYILSFHNGEEFGKMKINLERREPIIAARDKNMALQIYRALKS